MKNEKKFNLKDLQIERLNKIIEELKTKHKYKTREEQATVIGLNSGKELSDIVNGHRNMSPGIADIISQNLDKNTKIFVSSAYLIGMSDDINGHEKQTRSNNGFDFVLFDKDILKYINDNIGILKLTVYYSRTDKETCFEEFVFFDDLTRIDSFNLENNITIIEKINGRKKERHDVTVCSVTVGQNIYTFNEFKTLYIYITKKIKTCFDEYNYLLSEFRKTPFEDSMIIG